MIFLLRLLYKVFFIWIIGSPPKYHIEMPQLDIKKQFTCHINGNRFLGVYVAGIIAKDSKLHKRMHIRETKICQCSLQAVKTGLCKPDSYFHQIMTL